MKNLQPMYQSHFNWLGTQFVGIFRLFDIVNLNIYAY